MHEAMIGQEPLRPTVVSDISDTFICKHTSIADRAKRPRLAGEEPAEETDGDAARTATESTTSSSAAGVDTKASSATAEKEDVSEEAPYELDLNRFPDKMRCLLENQTAPEALWWLAEGDALAIDKPKFMEQLLAQEFRGNKFSSITRKLNRW